MKKFISESNNIRNRLEFEEEIGVTFIHIDPNIH